MLKIFRKTLMIGLFSIIAIVILSSANFAQSTDIDNPTALKSRVLTGNLVGGSNGEYFYSFYAEPGSFTITIDVKTSGYNSTLDATLISNTNSGSGFAASAVHKGSGRGSKSFDVGKKKKIIMKLRDFSSSDGTFKLTISGNVSLPK